LLKHGGRAPTIVDELRNLVQAVGCLAGHVLSHLIGEAPTFKPGHLADPMLRQPSKT
jgi:hypothetical protein